MGNKKDAGQAGMVAPSPGKKPDAAYDAASGERALAELKARIDAVSPEQVKPARLDLELVAIAVLGVASRANEPSLRKRFLSLPSSEFDRAHLDLLEPLAWAAWHSFREQQAASATTSEAQLPAALVLQAMELERRMQRCAEYHLDDDPEIAPTLAHLRAGNGYRDLAGDLAGYAALYKKHIDRLKHDRKLYRASDADEAIKLSTRMLKLLGAVGGDEAQRWAAIRDRVWVLLEASYDEVAAAGAFLERHHPNVASLYPSLHAIGRPGSGHRPGDEPPPEPPSPAPRPG